MKYLQRIFDDLKNGENIDLYLTIIAAVLVAILNLVGFASSTLLNSLSLAIFALIASAILGNRYRLDDIQDKLNRSNEPPLTDEYPQSRDGDIERATEIWWIGVHAMAFLRRYRKTLQEKLKNGDKLRVLLVDPNGMALSMVAARNPGKISFERERANIVASLQDLYDLKSIAPQNMEIRVIDDPLMYGGCIVNPDKNDGMIYIVRYTYQTGFRPRFTYRRKSEWYEFIKSEFQSLWNRGKTWEENAG
jgi:hypothetical protein